MAMGAEPPEYAAPMAIACTGGVESNGADMMDWVCRGPDGLDNRVHRLRLCGNGVVRYWQLMRSELRQLNS